MVIQTNKTTLFSGPYSPELKLSIARWINLVDWWQEKTKHRIFRSKEAFSADWIVYPDERCGDPEAYEVLTSLQHYGKDLEPLEKNWWRWDDLDPAVISHRRKLHIDLVNAAKNVLTLSKPMEEYSALISASTNQEYINRLNAQLPSVDHACWDMLVGPDVWKAAYILANTENPYPTNIKAGKGYKDQNKTKIRRVIVKLLNNLRTNLNHEIKPQELAVLCLLVAPWHFGQYPDDIDVDYPRPIYLTGGLDAKKRSWAWGKNNLDKNAADLLACDGFKALAKQIGEDRVI